MENSALLPQTIKRLEEIGCVDLLVGIPSYNNAHTINYVVYQAAQGLESHFPDLKALIFVSDGYSTDGTLDTVLAMQLPFKAQVITANYVGVPGKGSAVKAVFEAAQFLNARAIALVDSDLRSITPKWIELLISPTLQDTGLVTPYYVRDKYDGTITNFLCYPITSSLYGRKIRQPIGGDFSLSIDLVKELLISPLWQTPYVPTFGIDIFETHTALAKGFQVKQAVLGAKIHEKRDPSKHLASMFQQVGGSLFSCIEHYESVWSRIEKTPKVETIGDIDYRVTSEPVSVDINDLIGTFKANLPYHNQVYRKILSEPLLTDFQKLRKKQEKNFIMDPEIWAKSVYSFAAGFRRQALTERERLLEALRILWIGRVASFVNQTRDLDTLEANSKIEEEVETFTKLKPFLLNAFKMDQN